MTYCRSRALTAFRSNLSELLLVARYAPRIRHGGRRNRVLVETTLSSVILIGFAHFEEFVREAIENCFTTAAINGLSNARVPHDSRLHVVIAKNLGVWTQGTNESVLDRLMAERGKGLFLALDDSAPISRSFGVDLILDAKYPKPENIEKLFRRLGVKKPFGKMDAKARRNTRDLLTSFHDARTALAHEGVPPGWAPIDFQSKLRELNIVASAFDRVLFDWTSMTLGPECWLR